MHVVSEETSSDTTRLVKSRCGRSRGWKQADQKAQHDSHAKSHELFVGQRVVVQKIQLGRSWIPGRKARTTVISGTGVRELTTSRR